MASNSFYWLNVWALFTIDFWSDVFCIFSTGTPSSEQAPSTFGDDDNEQNSDEPPTVVVYIVNPFSSNSREDSFPSYVGLLRCIAEISPVITEGKKNVVFQV